MPTSVVLGNLACPVCPCGGAKCATFTTWATACCWSAPTASAPSTGCCRPAFPTRAGVLTQIAAFWFEQLGEPNHLITTDVEQMDLPPGGDRRMLAGRSTLVPQDRRWCPSSAWSAAIWPAPAGRNISAAARSAASRLPAGLTESAPAAGADFHPRRPRQTDGHDENISFERMAELVGRRAGRRIAPAQSGHLPPRRRLRPPARHPHRRHEIRVGPGRRPDPADRRGAHARQFAFLAGRSATRRAAASRRSTSNSSAIGCRPAAGTRTAPPCPAGRDRRARRGRNMSRRTSG